MTDTTKLASIIAKAIDSLPEDKREEVAAKVENLFEKLANTATPEGAEQRKRDFVQMVQSNSHLGEMIYEIAFADAPDDEVPDFDELSVERKMFWTLLAMRTNFDPANHRCVCPGCMGQSGEELFNGDEPAIDGEGSFAMTGTEADLKRMLETRELPPEVVKMLRAKGIDPSEVNIEVIKLDSPRKH